MDGTQTEKPAPAVHMSVGDFISLVLLGGAVGVLIWGLGLLLEQYVFSNFLCQNETSATCASSQKYALITSSILSGIIGLVGLIRIRVYRPLLVLIASLIGAWGVVQLSSDLPLYTGIAAVVLMYGIAFGAFGWIARVREFFISLAIILILVIALRFVLNS